MFACTAPVLIVLPVSSTNPDSQRAASIPVFSDQFFTRISLFLSILDSGMHVVTFINGSPSSVINCTTIVLSAVYLLNSALNFSPLNVSTCCSVLMVFLVSVADPVVVFCYGVSLKRWVLQSFLYCFC